MPYKNRKKQLKILLDYQKALGILKKRHNKEFRDILKNLKNENKNNKSMDKY